MGRPALRPHAWDPNLDLANAHAADLRREADAARLARMAARCCPRPVADALRRAASVLTRPRGDRRPTAASCCA